MTKEVLTAIMALCISLFSLYVNCMSEPTTEAKLECVSSHIKGAL